MPITTEFLEFKLHSGTRPSNETPLTTEELALEECKKQFKARELDKRILLQGPKPLEKSLTGERPQFKEFRFRLGERKRKEVKHDEHKIVFRARSMPKFNPKPVVSKKAVEAP